VNANDATLTALTTAQTGSTAPYAPANPGFDLILGAAAGSALGSSGTGSRRALKPARPGHTTSGQRAPGAIPAAMAHPRPVPAYRPHQPTSRCTCPMEAPPCAMTWWSPTW
jgi:hypothetical protein